MLELLLAVCLVIAIKRSVIAGRRLETACAVVALYLFVLDTANFTAASFYDLHPLHAFIFSLLGPGMWHHRGVSGLVGGGLLAMTPWLARAIRLVLCGCAAWRCSLIAARLGPLVRQSETFGWVAAPFYGAAIVDALESLLFAMARLLVGDGYGA